MEVANPDLSWVKSEQVRSEHKRAPNDLTEAIGRCEAETLSRPKEPR